MIGEEAIIFALAVLLALCAVLIGRKLLEMLTSREPYWLRREGYVDKRSQPFTHGLYVCVVASGLVVSLGLLWLCIWTAMHV